MAHEEAIGLAHQIIADARVTPENRYTKVARALLDMEAENKRLRDIQQAALKYRDIVHGRRTFASKTEFQGAWDDAADNLIRACEAPTPPQEGQSDE